MKEDIYGRLREKCQQLALGKSVRSRNVLSRILKDIDGQFIPLMRGEINVRSFPQCGAKTAIEIEEVLEQLRPFFNEFIQIYKTDSASPEKMDAKLIAYDYPFLSEDEQAFVASFLQAEGHFPHFYLASRYFHKTANRHVQIFALANGILDGHVSFEVIGRKFGMSRERVRQLSLTSVIHADDAGKLWNKNRWRAQGLLDKQLLSASTIHWDEIQQKEMVGNLDLYAALAIIRQMVPVYIISVRGDGRRANTRFSEDIPWQTPDVIFGYDHSRGSFPYESVLSIVGHEAALQRITDSKLSLSNLVNPFFKEKHNDSFRQTVINNLREMLPLFKDVETDGDDIIFRANHLNYTEAIYQILQCRGEAMTLDEIFTEFLKLYPDDHHTDTSFIRSYMLRDGRFEAVGSKSTYQLREWQRFAGALGDLAVHILEKSEEPINVTTLCQQMMEQRPGTTLKSCNTSIYIAVCACRLLYYTDSTILEEEDDEEDLSQSEKRKRRSFVGLFDREYDARFWPSTVTMEGTIRGIRRFIAENGRWPFASGKSKLEHSLYHVMRKYTKKQRLTEDERQRYEQGLADIHPYDFPQSERDQSFMLHCRQFKDYWWRNLHYPTGKLMTWYQSQCAKAAQFTGFRKYHFEQLQAVIASTQDNSSI